MFTYDVCKTENIRLYQWFHVLQEMCSQRFPLLCFNMYYSFSFVLSQISFTSFHVSSLMICVCIRQHNTRGNIRWLLIILWSMSWFVYYITPWTEEHQMLQSLRFQERMWLSRYEIHCKFPLFRSHRFLFTWIKGVIKPEITTKTEEWR